MFHLQIYEKAILGKSFSCYYILLEIKRLTSFEYTQVNKCVPISKLPPFFVQVMRMSYFVFVDVQTLSYLRLIIQHPIKVAVDRHTLALKYLSLLSMPYPIGEIWLLQRTVPLWFILFFVPIFTEHFFHYKCTHVGHSTTPISV